MSLDVYLYSPQKCPHCGGDLGFEKSTLYEANVTHNLGGMASAAGIYDCCWQPKENGLTHAKHLIEPLERGLAALKADPAKFEALNPKNGWGSYAGFVPWVEAYLNACRENPEAEVRASR